MAIVRRFVETLGPVEGDDKSGLSWQGLHELLMRAAGHLLPKIVPCPLLSAR